MFLEKTPFDNLSIGRDWHHVELRFGSGALVVKLDGRQVGRFAVVSHEGRLIGFRAGQNESMVDNIEVRAFDGRRLVDESFRNRNDYWMHLGVFASIVFAIAASIHLVCRWRRIEPTLALFSVLMAQLVTLCVLAGYFIFDFYFWSRLYHYETRSHWAVNQAQIQQLERWRVSFFQALPFAARQLSDPGISDQEYLIDILDIQPRTEYRDIRLEVTRAAAGPQRVEVLADDRQSIAAYLQRNPLQPSVRILLLGTSQLWGSGAISKFDRIGVRFQKILSEQFRGAPEISLINASVRGSRDEELLERYRSHLYLFEPNLVIISLSNNDHKNGFDESLTALIEQNRSIGASTHFVLEANSADAEQHKIQLQNKHAQMRQVAIRHNIPLLDLHGRLTHDDLYDSGLLWWDHVHLTSYGQSVAAEVLARGVLETFEYHQGEFGRIVRRVLVE